MIELNRIYNEDCLEGMKLLDDNSIDSVMTDPPYELGFMGKKWDKTGIAYNIELWKECLRILKPGGHLLAFGGTRTYHRMTCAIEDAGFEIRDCIQWLYGSGFPKSHDISKAIDKKLGAEMDIIGVGKGAGKNPKGFKFDDKSQSGGHLRSEYNLTAPSTPEAKQWEGWGTALKPANEPIVVARKPISEKTIAENVMKWGTGGLNIDGCRVATNSETPKGSSNGGNETSPQGRWPANLIHDGSDEVVELFPVTAKNSAARFFYCAKASKKDRGADNNHPTVKPTDLMRYLCRLVTRRQTALCLIRLWVAAALVRRLCWRGFALWELS